MASSLKYCVVYIEYRMLMYIYVNIADLHSRDIRVQQGAALVSDLMCRGRMNGNHAKF